MQERITSIDQLADLIGRIKTREGADSVAKLILANEFSDDAKNRIRELWHRAVDRFHCNEYFLPVEAHLFV